MVHALANYLDGRDFLLLGAMPRWRAYDMRLLVSIANALPRALQEQVYIWSGRFEAIAARKLHQANTDQIAEWVTGLYPKRKYPAVAIGSRSRRSYH